MGQPVPTSGLLNSKAQQLFLSIFAQPLSLQTVSFSSATPLSTCPQRHRSPAFACMLLYSLQSKLPFHCVLLITCLFHLPKSRDQAWFWIAPQVAPFLLLPCKLFSWWGVILSQRVSFFLWSELERVFHFQAQPNKVCYSLAHGKHRKCWSENLSLVCPDR